MKKKAKIGWILLGLSVVMCAWVIVSQSVKADATTDFELSEDGTELISYKGPGGAVTIPDGVTTIHAGAFSGKTAVTSVTMPNTVTTIGDGAFSGCKYMTSINLSSALTSIRAKTFYGCESLNNVTIPSSVSSIGADAFAKCYALSGITIPASITTCNFSSAFDECNNLSAISVASGNSNFSSYGGCVYNANKSRLVYAPKGLTSANIASDCVTIGANAFADCNKLTKITVPATVSAVEAGAFNSSAIDYATFKSATTAIADQGFWDPVVIYGIADSTAEVYAMNHNIPFEVDGAPDPTPGPEPTPDDPTPDDPTPTPTPTPTPEIKPGDIIDVSGGVVNPDGTITMPDGTVCRADGTVISVGSRTAGTGATPKTAGPIDSRYFLCMGVALIGLALIILGRRKKTVMITESRK